MRAPVSQMLESRAAWMLEGDTAVSWGASRTQDPALHPSSAAQAMPHPPQWSSSVEGVTHAPPQMDWPGGQAWTQAKFVQLAVPPVGGVQTLPHAPQSWSSSTTRTHAPLQSASVEGQDGVQ
jgi:hypothetical protein